MPTENPPASVLNWVQAPASMAPGEGPKDKDGTLHLGILAAQQCLTLSH